MEKILLILIVILLLGCTITKGEVAKKFTMEEAYPTESMNYTRYFLTLVDMRSTGRISHARKEVLKAQYDSVIVGDYIDLLEEKNK